MCLICWSRRNLAFLFWLISSFVVFDQCLSRAWRWGRQSCHSDRRLCRRTVGSYAAGKSMANMFQQLVCITLHVAWVLRKFSAWGCHGETGDRIPSTTDAGVSQRLPSTIGPQGSAVLCYSSLQPSQTVVYTVRPEIWDCRMVPVHSPASAGTHYFRVIARLSLPGELVTC